jgi:putative holliday junction resolvase
MNNKETRILGIDLGTKLVGLAIADWEIKIATGFEVIEYKNKAKFIDSLKTIAKDENIGLIVFGLPKNMDDTEGPKAKEARKIAELAKNSIPIEIDFEDESLTTYQSIRDLHSGEGKVGKSREKINMMAAILILQSYLDNLPSK